jgi:hypothetical protein
MFLFNFFCFIFIQNYKTSDKNNDKNYFDGTACSVRNNIMIDSSWTYTSTPSPLEYGKRGTVENKQFTRTRAKDGRKSVGTMHLG